jgi:quercetin dioxygenase-like cupin family protein
MKIYKKGDLDIFMDERGKIANMLPDGAVAMSVMYITGKQGSVRGNHSHKRDSHYCFLIKGRLRYEYQEEGKEKKSEIIEVGDMVYSPPIEKHKFIFLEDGVFVAMATNARTHDNYEDDVVREDF